jgi:hypothetical protein
MKKATNVKMGIRREFRKDRHPARDRRRLRLPCVSIVVAIAPAGSR